MSNINNPVSLIITTYNWEKALNQVIQSALNQTVLPGEVIIADDGSKPPTKELIQKFQKNSPIPIIHSWQEDDGFRAAMSRNKAIAKASYEYLIIIDGDIILHLYVIAYDSTPGNAAILAEAAFPANLGARQDMTEMPDFGTAANIYSLVDIGRRVNKIIHDYL